MNWKLWVALFYPEQSVEFWQNLYISQASQVLMWRRKKIRLKNLQKQISPIWFHFCYILIKRSLQKNYERNPLCGQNSIWGSYRDWLLRTIEIIDLLLVFVLLPRFFRVFMVLFLFFLRFSRLLIPSQVFLTLVKFSLK